MNKEKNGGRQIVKEIGYKFKRFALYNMLEERVPLDRKDSNAKGRQRARSVRHGFSPWRGLDFLCKG